MANEVVIIGRAEFDQVFQTLKKVSASSKTTADEIKEVGRRSGETLQKSARTTEGVIKNTASVMRRMLNQLWGDIKGLASLQSLQAGLKLSNQFSGAAKESIKLSDTIRRLGPSFGLAKSAFGDFQAKLAKGLGDIGASSEEAADALQGLSGKGIKDQDAIMNLTKGAVTLGGIGGERGQSGNIAGLLAQVLQAQGKNVNNVKDQQELIGEVTAAVQSSGKNASEILGAMEQVFGHMSKDLLGKLSPKSMAQAATVAATAGPEATKGMQEFLSKSKIERLAMEAQGVKFFDKMGNIDMKGINDFIKAGAGRIPGDPRKGLESMGFSPEAAEGLLRLQQQSDQVTKNLQALGTATRDNEAAFKSSMGLLDSFKGSINTVKGNLEQWSKGLTQKATDFLSKQVGSKAGSAAVVAGGGLIAALLAGGGLRGLGGLLSRGVGGALKKEAYETITGEKVIPVYVTNASEIGGGGLAGAGGMLAGAGSMLGKAGLVGTAAVAGYELGDKVINPLLDKYTTSTNSEGFEGNAVEQLLYKLDKVLGGRLTGIAPSQEAYNKMKIEIHSKDPNIKGKVVPSRGASH